MGQPLNEGPNRCAVVCLCGSAGALDAYRAILASLTAAHRVAIVVLAHRQPGNHTLLPLLAKVTNMSVSEVEEGMAIEPNRVFLMPPRGVHMTTTEGRFHLKTHLKLGWPTSITAFLSSLAKSVGSRAVAVILSGMAADGSAALGAIKAGGGKTFAQSGAVYESMPQHAIDTGHVDYVLSAPQIGAHLANIYA